VYPKRWIANSLGGRVHLKRWIANSLGGRVHLICDAASGDPVNLRQTQANQTVTATAVS